jgi:hypothetical protein
VLVAGFAFALFAAAISTARSQTPPAEVTMLRAVDAADLGLAHPVGLSYSPAADVFMVLGRPDAALAQKVVTFTPFEDRAGVNLLAARLADPLNVAFVPGSGTLLAFDRAGTVSQFLVGDRVLRSPAGQNARRSSTRALDLGATLGAAVDTAGNRLFLLDADGPAIVEIRADLSDVTSAFAAGRAGTRRIPLDELRHTPVRGMAYNPANGYLYTIAPDGATLIELTDRGRVVNRYDLSDMYLTDPQGMIIAPSADPTDDPAVMNLYLADSGGDRNQGRIIEITFAPQVDLPAAIEAVTLVNVIDTSKAAWDPSSPDPAGLAYRPSIGRLVISDSEVEESHPDYQGFNVFESTVGGTLGNVCTTVAFSREPTGAAANPANDRIYFSDDNANSIFEVNLVDGIYCNGNDIVTTINVLSLYGIDDAEGVALGNNTLFIAGGVTTEVYRISLGTNGVIGGGDDTYLGSFDTNAAGVRDPEGIEFNSDTGTVFVSSAVLSDEFVVEYTQTGTMLVKHDLDVVGREPRSGLAFAPASDGSGEVHLYIASRGVDNGADPNENDGKIYEVDLGGGPVNTPTPTNTPVDTSTPTPTDTPVDTSTPTSTPVDTNTPTPTSTPVDTSTPTSTPVSTSTLTPTNTPVNTSTPTPTNTPVNTSTPTPTRTPTPTPVPPPPAAPILISLLESGPTLVGNLGDVRDEDIIGWDGNQWSMVFDGSDVGLTTDIDAFHMLDADTILLSLPRSRTFSGLGTVAENDILRFDATSLGANTAGVFSLYFDGSDVGLSTTSEDIDALSILSDGRIVISTMGDASVPGVSATDEDLLVFTPTTLGATTTGTWAMYFDGSDVGLSASSEDVDGMAIAANGDIYLSTPASFSVTGLSGADEDVFICRPTSLGANTACTFLSPLVFDGSAFELNADDVDGLDLP